MFASFGESRRQMFHEFLNLNVHGVLMGVFVDHTSGCSVYFIMDRTFVDTLDGRHPTVLLCSGVNY